MVQDQKLQYSTNQTELSSNSSLQGVQDKIQKRKTHQNIDQIEMGYIKQQELQNGSNIKINSQNQLQSLQIHDQENWVEKDYLIDTCDVIESPIILDQFLVKYKKVLKNGQIQWKQQVFFLLKQHQILESIKFLKEYIQFIIRQQFKQEEKNKRTIFNVIYAIIFTLSTVFITNYVIENYSYNRFGEIEYLCPKKLQYQVASLNCIDKFVSPKISYFWSELFFTVFPIYISWIAIHLRINSYFSYIPIVLYSKKIFQYYDPEPSFSKLKSTDIGVALQICFMALLLISTGLTIVMYTLFKTLHISYKKKKLLFLLELIILAGIILSVKNKYDNSCDGWEKGLTGEIDFKSTEYCQIQKPKQNCINSFIDGWIDLSPKNMCHIQDLDLYRENLINLWFYGDVQVNPKNLQKIESGNAKALAFPNTAEWSLRKRNPVSIQHRVTEQSKLFSSVQEGIDQNHETILDLETMELKFNIQKNQNLINQRKKLQKKDSIADNIVVIYIDTLSRSQAHRKMKKTLEFFDKFAIKPEMNQNQKQKIYDLGRRTFEFYRFHVVGQKTLPILFRFIYGIKYIHKKHPTPEKKSDHLFKYFKDNGYIVGLSTNTCTMNCLLRTSYMRPDVIDHAPDHEFQQAMYDPQYVNPKDYFSITQGPNSIQRRCLYGKDFAQHVLDYGYEFMNKYKNEKKVLYLEFTDAHEVTDEVVGYADQPIRNFLDKLEAEGLIKDKTTIYLMSDHGQHLKKLFYFTESIKQIYLQERSLPALFMIQTTDIFKQNPQLEKNLEQNEQKLFGIEQLRTSVIMNGDSMKNIQNNSDHIFGDMVKNKHCHDLDLEKYSEDDNLCHCTEYKYEPEFNEEEQQNISIQEQQSIRKN